VDDPIEAEDGAQALGLFWHDDYYDYLVNHEVYLFQVPGHVVHVCTAHPLAAAAARAGCIPTGFSCPLRRPDCPMERLLSCAPGKSFCVSLSVRFKPGL
jgi:hypothetical protein